MGVDPIDRSPTEGADAAIRALAWLALVAALYGLWVALGNSGLAHRWWITSDSLYPVHVFIDTVLEGNPFSAWKFSVAPCWFPDLTLTALFMMVTRNPIVATLLAGFVQIGALVVGLRVLARAAGYKPGPLPEAAAIAGAIGCLLYVMSDPGRSPGLYGQMFLPQTHVGAVILLVYALAAAMWHVRVGKGLLAWTVLCFLGGLSDLMFVVQTLGPLTLTLPVFARVSAVRLLASGWIAAAAGYAINRLAINTTDVMSQTALRIGEAVGTFIQGFIGSLLRLDVAHWVAVLWVSTVLLIIRAHREKNAALVLGTLVLSGFAGIGATIVGGSATLTQLGDYEATLRYLHPMFTLPLIALPFLLVMVLRPRMRTAMVGVAVLIVALPAISAARRPVTTPLSTWTPPLVQFIDEVARREGLKTGVAGYWQARPITLLSKAGVRAYAVEPSMQPFLWVSSAEWYKPLFPASGKPRTDFVVLDDPLFKHDLPAALKVFGEPARTVTYEIVRMLVYRCRTCEMSAAERAAAWMDEPLPSFEQDLATDVQRLEAKAGAVVELPVQVRNPRRNAWASTGKRPVNLSFKILRGDSPVVENGTRALFDGVLAGGTGPVELKLQVTAPAEPGDYTVRVSLVQETVAWFMDKGGKPLDVPLTVR